MSRIWATDSAPSLSDVARASGVSIATASRVLNGSSRSVSDASRQKVEAAATLIGYLPYTLAQATARGASSMISLIVSDLADPYFGLIAAGVAHEADDADLVLSLAVTERDPARELRLIRALRGQRPRVVIFAESRADEDDHDYLEREIDALETRGSRIVVLGTGLPDRPRISVKNREGAHSLGESVAALGYRRAIILSAALGIATSDERLAGLCQGFGTAGGKVAAIYRGDFSRTSGAELMARALKDGVPRRTVVFAVGDTMAVGAMAAIREAGRTVGADIAVAGFGGSPSNHDVHPALSTVHLPLFELGRLAVRAGIEQSSPLSEGSLGFQVVLRDSTPRAADRK